MLNTLAVLRAMLFPTTRVIFFVLLLPLLVQAQQSELAYRFLKESTLRYRQVTTEKGFAQSQMGLNVEMNRDTETFYTVAVDRIDGDAVVLRVTQDTAIVQDKSPGGPVNQLPDFANALTGKPVMITMTSKGVLRRVQPLVAIRDNRFPSYMTDNVLARRAMIFTQLPARQLTPGLSWIETQSDTTYPMRDTQGTGQRASLRYSTAKTRFDVGKPVTIGGYECLPVTWKSEVFVEGKLLYPETDVFTEDRTTISGTLHFAVREGLLVEVTVKTETEAMRVVYGKDSEISPSSTVSDMTLRLIK